VQTPTAAAPRPRCIRRLTATAAVAAAILLAACGDHDDSAATTTTAAPVTTAVETTTTAPAPETAEVTSRDFEFAGLPERVRSGTKFTVVNESTAELHELVAFKLDASETRSADEIARLPMEELMPMFAGEPAMVLLATPGGEQINAVGDGTLTEPGRYLVFCAIPIGADPQEYLAAAQTSDGPPQVEGGPPHFTAGMYGEVTVE
jgi:uncharacterized cupredoxin-like copper-binding protein